MLSAHSTHSPAEPLCSHPARRVGHGGRVPLLSPSSVRQAEETLFSWGLTQEALMELAAERVWQALRPHGDAEGRSVRVLVIAGPGHNGADGWAVARKAAEEGHAVDVVSLAAERKPLTEVQRHIALAQGVQELTQLPGPTDLSAYAFVVDALYGIGLTHALPEEAQVFARGVRGAPRVVALDVPSGVCARTGRVLCGDPSSTVVAHETLVLGAHKPGLLSEAALRYTGLLHFLPLGFPHPAESDAAVESFPLPFDFLRKGGDEHKLSRGEVLVVAGSAAYPGAGRLALEGLCALEPGYVRLVTDADVLVRHVMDTRPEIILARRVEEPLPRTRVGVFGCGLSEPSDLDVARWTHLLPSDTACVLDGSWCVPRVVERFRERAGTVIVTPHGGEFARLCPDVAHDLAQGRVSKAEAASIAAQRLACYVVLKGPYSVCASPEGRVFQSVRVEPSLARAGTGDTFAGVLGGVLLHGRHAHLPVLDLMACAVELHAEAARWESDVGAQEARCASALGHIERVARRVASAGVPQGT